MCETQTWMGVAETMIIRVRLGGWRDHQGRRIWGFQNYVPCHTIEEAELVPHTWAALIFEIRIPKIEIEMDCYLLMVYTMLY